MIEIYTDGACSGNPGPGGWAGIILTQGYEIQITGGEPSSTNNRSELMAVHQSLKYLEQNQIGSDQIVIYTDSRLVSDGLTKWVINWAQNNWKTARGSGVKNADIWQSLHEQLLRLKSVTVNHVPGHAGVHYNEQADQLAKAAVKQTSGQAWTSDATIRKEN